MTRVEQLRDLETAKQGAALLEAENARLHQRLEALVAENARLKGEDAQAHLHHADETHWLLLDKGPGTKWYAWTVASPDTVFHRIYPSRSGATARTVLGDYEGVVLVDGYAAYQTATKSSADGPCPATLAFCWAHVRRKFFEAQQFAPACKEVLDLIGELYAVEADLPGWYALEGEERQAALAHRLAVRQQKSAPLTERIRDWAHAQRALPGSAFRKALEYMLNLWAGLTVFLTQPQVPLDNNHVERQLRDMVIGRKNLKTARLRGEAPGHYLRRPALAAIENPGTVTLPKAQS
uniref:Transposase IS66 central domain-containing protein n=1 Tax=Archangium disciforme TaxID=38 RepID=Q5ZP99_9BACT|nr:hypothetical protein [Archangium disciforme]